jgi:hypothetical protein
MSAMRFASEADGTRWLTSCQIKCKVDSGSSQKDNVFCTGNFVDCSGYGGFDPTDPCKQTCVSGGPTSRTPRDTARTEVNPGTRSIISKGQKIAVTCRPVDGAMECFDGDNKKVKMPEKVDLSTVWKPGQPPAGQEWDYECSFFEKLYRDNCWDEEGQSKSIRAVLESFGLDLSFFRAGATRAAAVMTTSMLIVVSVQ